jgi:hypothetical protein
MKDNAALKTISEDQKRVAIMATRDSAAMSVISAITAVFLPATFTAVSCYRDCVYRHLLNLPCIRTDILQYDVFQLPRR